MAQAPSAMGDALEKLRSAVDLLDAAAMRRLSSERSEQARQTELELMRGDRAKLAELLDQALVRGRTLEAAQKQAQDSVDRAITLVRQTLAEKD
jgi:dihydroxyacetone kinase DhaKLM complex PTS-EIIA-like component DhaM